ncbi:unnamed protein product [Prorocentrum cordatum]|uniref:Cyclin C-terminal domain-containing protein n=1 Tax=Prorocentrum cordatum TaxID=2364126 RepID=A0ABN9VSH9_9DINO|nr:unnamed protein product [Polarella glacialis]
MRGLLLSEYLLHLAALSYPLLAYPPQVVVAAVVAITHSTLGEASGAVAGWQQRLLRCARVAQEEVAPCLRAAALLHACARGGSPALKGHGKLLAAFRKFSRRDMQERSRSCSWPRRPPRYSRGRAGSRRPPRAPRRPSADGASRRGRRPGSERLRKQLGGRFLPPLPSEGPKAGGGDHTVRQRRKRYPYLYTLARCPLLGPLRRPSTPPLDSPRSPGQNAPWERSRE